jgi:hypothetical protein
LGQRENQRRLNRFQKRAAKTSRKNGLQKTGCKSRLQKRAVAQAVFEHNLAKQPCKKWLEICPFSQTCDLKPKPYPKIDCAL